MLTRFLSIFFLFISISATFSQTSLNRIYENAIYNDAINHFRNSNYSAARIKFEEYILTSPTEELKAEARYYEAFSAMQLFNQDAEALFESFVIDYPTHPKAMLAYFELGNFYFRNEKYKKAGNAYQKVKIENLSSQQKSELRFRLGYSYFNTRNLSAALPEFSLVAKEANTYQGAASYYAGFISIELGNYDEAIDFLELAATKKEYEKVIPFYLTKVYYNREEFDKVISYSEPALLKIPDLKNKAMIQLMLADAYYFKEDYRRAYNNFNKSISASGKQEFEVFYRAGFTAYQSGFFKESVEYLKNAALAKDKIGQYASYYLGMSYLKLNNKPFASTAFENASKQDFDENIKNESLFNLGKVDFETGNIDGALSALKDYQNAVPNSEHTGEVNELISEAYLLTDNVEVAISYIESLSVKSDKVLSVYQKVTARRAKDLFNAGRYFESVQMSNKSNEHPFDKEVLLDSYFWQGEAYSIGNRWVEALDAYRKVIKNDTKGQSLTYLKTQYGIGYAYFNTKEYNTALGHFRRYVERVQKGSNQFFYKDALIRLADCNYAVKNYNNAIAIYERAINAGIAEPDYCFYHIGLISSITGNNNLAENNLNTVINRFPESIYRDDALFQRGQLAFENGNYQPAIDRFSRLIKEQPQSPYIPQALVSRAISHYNLNQYGLAIDDYILVITTYPNHTIANSALLSLQEALTAADRANEFDTYLSQYKQANPGDKALSSIEFESAKNLYFSQNYSEAINSFSKYLHDYPGESLVTDAFYYRGESQYRLNDYESALNDLEKVLENKNSKWFKRALNRCGYLYAQTGAYRKATDNYLILSNLAGNRREEFDAMSGLMQAYFITEEYDSSIFYGKEILEKGAFSANAQNRTQLIIGKSYLAKGDKTEATDYFLATVNTAKDVFGAESQYLIAKIYRENGDYERSNNALFDLNKNFGIYEEWIGKSFLMIADNYIDQGELFQAKATLNSVFEKSPLDEIVRAANLRLEEIEEMESEIIAAPDSILIDDENEIEDGNE